MSQTTDATGSRRQINMVIQRSITLCIIQEIQLWFPQQQEHNCGPRALGVGPPAFPHRGQCNLADLQLPLET